MDKLIEKWAKIPARQRYLLVGVILAALGGGYWYLFYADDSAKLGKLETQYHALEAQRAEKQAYVDNLAKYEARLAELHQALNVRRAQLPDEVEVAQLLAQLDNKGRQSGLDIEKFQPQGEKIRDFVGEIAFALEVRGSYHEIATFIDSIGNLDRIINVKGISLTGPKTENQKVVVKGQFTIRTFRYVAQAEKKK